MAGRFRFLFLGALSGTRESLAKTPILFRGPPHARTLVAAAISCGILAGCAHTRPEVQVPQNEQEAARIIEPEIERREIKPPKIDTENFEIGAFAGILSIEDFGSNPVYGVRGAYHIAEDLFLEAAVGKSEAGLTSAEELGGNLRILDDRDYLYYNISFGYNFLPGEIFLGRNYALTNQFYLIGGVGGTRFNSEDHFTFNVGAGLRVLATDWLAIHVDVRDHVFATDLLGRDKATNNLEATLGFTFFF
jgi:outer membrane beta-barrel protein